MGKAWNDLTRVSVRIREENRWLRSIRARPILRSYIHMKSVEKLQLASYLRVAHGGWNDRILSGRRAMTRLRTGTNELHIHTGRFDRTPADQRRCRICADEHDEESSAPVEDEKHFLCECDHYSTRRDALFESLDRIIASAASVDPSSASSSPPTLFTISTLSSHHRFLLLTCSPIPHLTDTALTRRIHSAILVAVAEWIRMRKERVDSIENAMLE